MKPNALALHVTYIVCSLHTPYCDVIFVANFEHASNEFQNHIQDSAKDLKWNVQQK